MRRYRRSRRLKTADPLDVDDIANVADGAHDLLQLPEVLHLHHEVVDAAAVLGHGDLRLRDVAVARGDGARDLREQAGTVGADVDGDADGSRGGLFDVPLD